MKTILKKLFPDLIAFRNRLINQWQHKHFRNQSIDQVFQTIYRVNHWRDQESISGPGSTINITSELRARLPDLIKKYGVSFFLDIPCGDFNWMREINFGVMKYKGIDIVKELVEINQASFARENRSFEYGDITSSTLPQSDLIFCRDCFVHLSYHDIEKAISNIKRSGSRFILTTTFHRKSNHDITTGNWRPVNLCAKPFNWPQPIEMIVEDVHGDNSAKSMGLWRVIDLP